MNQVSLLTMKKSIMIISIEEKCKEDKFMFIHFLMIHISCLVATRLIHHTFLCSKSNYKSNHSLSMLIFQFILIFVWLLIGSLQCFLPLIDSCISVLLRVVYSLQIVGHIRRSSICILDRLSNSKHHIISKFC